MQKVPHIAHIPHKTAANIVAVTFPDDKFHQNILATARKLVSAGKAEWTYVSQGLSGTCLWVDPFGEEQEYVRA